MPAQKAFFPSPLAIAVNKKVHIREKKLFCFNDLKGREEGGSGRQQKKNIDIRDEKREKEKAIQ